MGYPYGPPGNQGFGAYPQPTYLQPVTPARKPSGGTAIAAGVLAAVQGVLALVETAGASITMRSDRHEGYGDDDWVSVLMLVLIATYCGLYLSGAIFLFARRRIGRYLIVGTSGLVLVGGACAIIVAVTVNGLANEDALPLGIVVAIAFVIQLLTLCLALASSTGRWIAARTTGPAATHPRPEPTYVQPQYPPRF
ncbi:hypothetical protein [Nocardia macrotermitis]|uniref:Uncharacterized protein n=1 Tax=Nocardia macrotermitis TaxID=2585198 RepID=A0A7K0D9I1_9NOCA|nr:hypothetical protein [Nocardia macrotermitis]MQY22387.1 hypothetical protein [Nocardia macrotermitis]